MSDEDNLIVRTKTDRNIIVLNTVLIVGIIVSVLTFREEADYVINYIRTLVTKYLNWYLVLLTSVLLFFSTWLIFGRYSKVVLGGKGAKPEFSRFSWYSMLFACGQGIGLIFWGIAEPLMMFSSGKFAPSGSLESINTSMAWAYFHWGIHAWVIYCVVAISLAFSIHNLNKPLTFRDSIDELLPKKGHRFFGVLAETVAILATVLGLSTSFGFAIFQFTAGLENLLNISISMQYRIIIILCFSIVVAYSVWSGVRKGVKIISELNSILSIVLLVVLFIFGPTIYILSLFVETTGFYLTNMLYMGFWNDSSSMIAGFTKWQESWSGWWTVFIWCWTYSFASFTGCFVAQISRGRTIRDFMIGVILIPSLIVVVWMCITGGSGIYYDIKSGGMISAAIAENTESGLFALFDVMNIKFVSSFLTIVSTVLIGSYYVSSLDSGVLVLSELVSSHKKPSRRYKLLLLGFISSIAITLFILGGDKAMLTVQIAAISAAIPFSILVILMCVNLFNRLRNNTHYCLPDKVSSNILEDVENKDK